MTIPEVIKENGFDFRWDNKKVWTLDIEVEEIDAKELEWILDLPFWTDGKAPYNLKARTVIDNIVEYPEHQARLNQADETFPIDIMVNNQGRWLILDGLHRYVKLVMRGDNKIKVRKVDREYIPQILKDLK